VSNSAGAPAGSDGSTGCATWFRFHAALNGAVPMDWSGWNTPKRLARRFYTVRLVPVVRAPVTASIEIADVTLAPMTASSRNMNLAAQFGLR